MPPSPSRRWTVPVQELAKVPVDQGSSNDKQLMQWKNEKRKPTAVFVRDASVSPTNEGPCDY